MRDAMVRGWGAMRRLLNMGELVGMDKTGNKFLRRMEKNYEGKMIERRWIESKQLHEDFNPASVPAEWSSWLAFNRLEPPTPEESAAIEARRSQVQARAAALMLEDQKRRLRARALDLDEATKPSAMYLAQANQGTSSNPLPSTPPPDSDRHAGLKGGGEYQPEVWSPSAPRADQSKP